MSDKMRWRYGDTNPVVAAVDHDTEIEIGDLLYQDVDDAKPASIFRVSSHQCNDFVSEVEDYQRLFANNFLGVAMQRSRKGDVSPIRVAATGVFEFDCPSGTFELGDLMGASGNLKSDGLLNQRVVPVAMSKYAIGRVSKRSRGGREGGILVDTRSTVMTGGVEGSSRDGV